MPLTTSAKVLTAAVTNASAISESVSGVYSSEETAYLHIIFLIFNFSTGGIFLAGILCNITVILAMIWFTRLKTISNLFILNLAVADFSYLVWIPLVIARSRAKQWLWGDAACKAYNFATGLSRWASVVFLTLLCIDRYCAVCHPVHSSSFRVLKVAIWQAVGAWTLAATVMSPLLFAASVRPEAFQGPNNTIIYRPQCGIYAIANRRAEPERNLVNFTHVNSGSAGKGLISTINMTLHGVVPGSQQSISNGDTSIGPSGSRGINSTDDNVEVFVYVNARRAFTLFTSFTIVGFMVVTWALYSRVLLTLRVRNQFTISFNRRRINARVTKIVLAILISFTLCWTPIVMLSLIQEYGHHIFETLPPTVFYSIMFIAYLVNYLNSALNPMLFMPITSCHRKLFWAIVDILVALRNKFGFYPADITPPSRQRKFTFFDSQAHNGYSMNPFVHKSIFVWIRRMVLQRRWRKVGGGAIARDYDNMRHISHQPVVPVTNGEVMANGTTRSKSCYNRNTPEQNGKPVERKTLETVVYGTVAKAAV